MRSFACILAVLISSSIIADDKGKNPKSDKELIQGTWEVVSFTEGGKDALKTTQFRQFVFTADKLTMGPKDAEGITITYSLDPTKDPRAIDSSHEIDAGKPIIQLGIYSLERDTLKLCLEAAKRPRPTTFESQPGDSHHVIVLKRVKK